MAKNRMQTLQSEAFDEANRQRSRGDQITHQLAVHANNPLATVERDLWFVWEATGFDPLTSEIRGSGSRLEGEQGTARDYLRQLADAHPGILAPKIEAQTPALLTAYHRAVETLWSLDGMLQFSNLRGNLINPAPARVASDTATSALNGLLAEVETMVAFLTQLHAEETRLISQIQTPTSGVHGVADQVLSFQAGSLLNPAPGSNGALFVRATGASASQFTVTPLGEAVAGAAKRFQGYFKPNSDNFAFNPSRMSKADQNAANAAFALAPSDWGMGAVQCVAFVATVYAAEGILVPRALGNADEWYSKLGGSSGWTQVGNRTGSNGWPPQKGDIVCMADGGDGHVAIVTNVFTNAQGQLEIEIAQSHTGSNQATLTVVNGVVNAPQGWDGYSVQGFVRYTGPVSH